MLSGDGKEEEKRVQDSISILCVIAALLATLSYTGVLTPPHILSECQDLCTASILKLSVSLLGSQLFVQNLSLPVVPEEAKYTVGTFDVDSIVREVLNNERDLREIGVPQYLTISSQTFLVFNGVALLSSLSCLIIAGVRVRKASTVQEYKSVEEDCLCLVIISSVAVTAAFIAAHMQVYYIDSFSAGLIMLLVFAGVFVVIVALGCFISISALLKRALRLRA